MKRSISVPDELDNQAETYGMERGMNISQVYQEGVRRLLDGDKGRPTFARSRPADIEDSFRRVRQSLTETAGKEYEAGYRAAVDLAEGNWWAVVLFQRAEWQWGKWASWLHGPDELSLWDPLVERIHKDCGQSEYDLPDDISSARPTYVLGFTRGMQDLWHAVMEDQQAAPEVEGADEVKWLE